MEDLKTLILKRLLNCYHNAVLFFIMKEICSLNLHYY